MSYFNQIKGLERSQGKHLERDIFVCLFVLVKMRDFGQLMDKMMILALGRPIDKKQGKEKVSESEVRGGLLRVPWN